MSSTPRVGGRVDLHHVDRRARDEVLTGRAGAARLRTGARGARQRLGQEPGGGGLAHAAGSGEEIGVGDPARAERVAERARDRVLPDDRVELLRPPLPRQDLIRQRPCTLNRTDRPAIAARNLLRPGTPTAHGRSALPLLPSGPGGVRRIPLRGAQPSTPSRTAHSTRPALEREFNPAVADCGLQGTATSPSSTVHLASVADKGPLASLAPSIARSTYREYASRALFGRRLATGPFSPTDKLIGSFPEKWRRGWDSNPRYGCPYTAFPVPHLRPLGHPSASLSLLQVRSNWRRGEDLNPRGTCAPIRFRVGRLQPGSATPPRNHFSILHASLGIKRCLPPRLGVRKSTPAMPARGAKLDSRDLGAGRATVVAESTRPGSSDVPASLAARERRDPIREMRFR